MKTTDELLREAHNIGLVDGMKRSNAKHERVTHYLLWLTLVVWTLKNAYELWTMVRYSGAE